MIHRVFIVLCMCLLMVSCKIEDSVREVNHTPEYLESVGAFDDVINSTERIKIPAASYYTYSILQKYEFPAKETNPVKLINSVTMPGASIEADKVVMIRNNPLGVMESDETWDAYAASDDYRKIQQIELFDYHTGESEYIKVTGLEDRKLNVMKLSQNPDGSISFIGRESGENGSFKDYLILLDASGHYTAQFEYTVDLNGSYILYYEKVYSLLPTNGYTIDPTVLTQTDLKTGETKIIAENVFAITINQDCLYYMTEIMNENYEYELYLNSCDLQNGEVKKISQIYAQRKNRSVDMGASRMRIFTIAYCEEEEVLFLGDYTAVYAYSLPTHEIVKVIESETIIELLGANSEALMLSIKSQQLHTYSVDTLTHSGLEESQPKLNVCVNSKSQKGFENANQEVIYNMRANNIAFRVNTVVNKESKDAYVNTMAKKLLAGDTDFDIFEVDSEMLELLKEGYYEELTQYPILNSYYNRLNSGAMDLCRVGNTTALIPRSLTSSVLAVNTRLCYNKDLEIPDSLNGLLDFSSSLNLKDGISFMTSGSAGTWMRLWFEQFTANFMAKRMDEDTALKTLTELFRIIASAGNTQGVVISSDILPQACVTAMTLTPQALKYGNLFTALPKLDETFGQAYSGSWYAVNPNSPNKDLAVMFLAYMMETDMTNNEMWYSNHTPQTGQEDLYKAYLAALEDSELLYIESELYEQYHKTAHEVEDNSISAETAADELYNIIKHIRDE